MNTKILQPNQTLHLGVNCVAWSQDGRLLVRSSVVYRLEFWCLWIGRCRIGGLLASAFVHLRPITDTHIVQSILNYTAHSAYIYRYVHCVYNFMYAGDECTHILFYTHTQYTHTHIYIYICIYCVRFSMCAYVSLYLLCSARSNNQVGTGEANR